MSGADPAPSAIELCGVVKAYGHRPVLRGIDLRVRVGETIAVLGANGSGKTTLLLVAATLARPTRGTVSLFGEPAAPLHAIRRRIGVVPHESLLYESLTLEENLRFFAGLYGAPHDRVAHMLHRTAMEPLARRRVRVLSRGQRQQANLARALLHDPDLLILDEPSTGLDLDAAVRLATILQEEANRGRTLLFSTHSIIEARALARGAAVLRDGRLSPITPPDRLDAVQLEAWFGEARR